MKNKEIEELLNELKDKYSYEPYDTTGKVYTTISYEEGQLLLSYIEQLENLCNKYEREHKITFEIWKKDIKKSKQLENRNKELYEGFMATQEELTDYAIKNEQLENNRDKALKIIESYELGKYDYSIPPGGIIELRNVLKGDSE